MSEAYFEDCPELPNNVEYLIGILVMNLSLASRDSGKSFYIDLFPENPELPDIYRADVSVQEPRDVFRG